MKVLFPRIIIYCNNILLFQIFLLYITNLLLCCEL